MEQEIEIDRNSSGLREVYRKRVWEKYEKRERERDAMKQLSRNRWDKKNQEK